MPIAFSPLQASYTRQQIHEATGLSLDVIGYWIKEGLLRANEAEGQGRGKHRRFGFEALHIAAILAELHRYGIGLTGLRGVADALWSAARLLEQFPGITENVVLDCRSVVSARKTYPPRASLLEADDETYCFEDWFEEMQSGKAAINPSAFQLEPIMTSELYAAFALHFDLFSERSFSSPHTRLLVARLPAGEVALWPTDIPGSEQVETLPAYLKLNVSLIIRGIWDGLRSQEPSPAGNPSENISSDATTAK
jgi:hypothetical protein